MGRSIKVSPKYIEKVKLAIKRKGYPSQGSFAINIGFSRATVTNFLNGKPVDFGTFEEICRHLDLDWQEIVDVDLQSIDSPPGNDNANSQKIELNSPTSEYYIKREPIETRCYQEVIQPGSLIRIKAPQKMGKTWLIDNILDSASREGYSTVPLNIFQAEESVINNLESFLRWICSCISRRLKLADKVGEYWDNLLGANDNCTAYFEEYILENIDTPLVLGFDNVDRVFEYPQTADFFKLLRSWFEDAKVMDVWSNVRLVVAHSTEVYIPLDVNFSPFNVGLPVELPEFNSEQVGLLAGRHGVDLKSEEIERIMAMVGGHPYLVDAVLVEMKNNRDLGLDSILEMAPTNGGIYRNYLADISQRLCQDEDLKAAMKSVIEAEDWVRLEDKVAFQLDSMGLVHKRGNEVKVRFLLYQLFFQERLL